MLDCLSSVYKEPTIRWTIGDCYTMYYPWLHKKIWKIEIKDLIYTDSTRNEMKIINVKYIGTNLTAKIHLHELWKIMHPFLSKLRLLVGMFK